MQLLRLRVVLHGGGLLDFIILGIVDIKTDGKGAPGSLRARHTGGDRVGRVAVVFRAGRRIDGFGSRVELQFYAVKIFIMVRGVWGLYEELFTYPIHDIININFFAHE